MAGKTQIIRLIDVIVLGPFMFTAARFMPEPQQSIMRFAGIATVLFNLNNFIDKGEL